MPARKLSQADLDDLKQADDELLRSSNPRMIFRDGANITTQAGIAMWKGISESHFHALKRAGWKLKRGLPHDESAVPELVPREAMRATFEMFTELLEVKDRRIAELEAQLKERAR